MPKIQILQNVNSYSYKKERLETRMMTFESPDSQVEEVPSTSEQRQEIARCCREIESQLLRHRTLILQEANFFFAYDTNKRLCLLFATSLRVNKHIDCLLGSSGVYLKYQGRENLKKSSVVPDAAQVKVEKKVEAASSS